jgi:hypothetical protein
MSVLLALIFGLIQGIRHAFEPDHVIAISTMIGEQRDARARIGYAAAWGTGHAATLLFVGALLILLRLELPPRVDASFELAISLMLMGLGARALLGALRFWRRSRRLREHPAHHQHGPRWRTVGPLAMGMIHGLAGSGALTALVVARLPSPAFGVVFIVLFGAGATLGMSLLAGAAGVPLRRLLGRRWGMPAILTATGGVSLGLGLAWFFPALLRISTI